MHLKTVVKYIRRSPYQAISAILIMSLTFLTVSVFAIISLLSIRIIDYFESRPQISVFFNPDTTQELINATTQRLEATGKTSSINFISQEEALAIYREFNKDEPLLVELVSADILPPSLDVKAEVVTDLPELAEVAQSSEGVDRVIFQKDIVDTLSKWTNAFRQIGFLVVLILSIVSIFIVLTIIGIKITNRRGEIEIMKLIGASDWFIRTPFVLEGIFYSCVGAVLGWVVAYGALLIFGPNLQLFFSGVPIFPIEPVYMFAILGIQILVAIILGSFASFIAVLRYLK
jgi:cell division transport system permease protein